LDVILPQERLGKWGTFNESSPIIPLISNEHDKKLLMVIERCNYSLDGWKTFDLELEELVIVQPYQQQNTSKERQWTTVAVAMSNCEIIGVNYSGLQVEYVELSSFTGSKEDLGKY
jgi:hypothetical protein